MPLLLALTAVFATFGLIALPSHLVPVAFEAPAMVLLIGLAVGVDYSMFYLKRERQERAAGRSPRGRARGRGRHLRPLGAHLRADRDDGDGRHVPDRRLNLRVARARHDPRRRGRGARLADRAARPAFAARRQGRPAARAVRRPLRRTDGEGADLGRDRRSRPSPARAVGGPRRRLLLALAAPALQLRLAPQGAESFPQSLDGHEDLHAHAARVPRAGAAGERRRQGPERAGARCRTAIAQLERRALASGRAFARSPSTSTTHGTVADITIPIAGNGTDAASNAAFHLLRDTIVPKTVGAVPDTEAGVTGQTAAWKDSAATLKSNLAPVVAFVLVLAFVLMLLAFRSIVVATKAILLNLLSVGAAYGVLVLVFQHGIGKGLLGVGKADGIEAVVPLLLFVILFGLSMDYHVFIVSRIREASTAARHGRRGVGTGSGRPPASSPAPRS